MHGPFVTVLLIAVFFNLATFVFLGHLIGFHIRLQRMKLTTYEFIKLKEDRKRESKIVKRINRSDTNKVEDESKF
jgi:hypothetical protein